MTLQPHSENEALSALPGDFVPYQHEAVFGLRGQPPLIVREGDTWRATGEISEMGIPGTLHGVLLARIDRLEEDVRRTLQMAAVIGRSFVYRLLEAISEAERQLDEHLSHLQRFDLVRDAERIAQQVEWRQELVAKLDGEAMELDAQEATLQVDLGRLTAEGETAAGRAAAIEVDLEELRGETLYQRLSEARTTAAVARGTWEHRRAESGSLQEGQVQLQAQIEAKRTRIADLEGEEDILSPHIQHKS